MEQTERCDTPRCREPVVPNKKLFGRPLRYCQFCLLILEGQLADRQFRDALLERARDYTEAVDRRRYERSQDA